MNTSELLEKHYSSLEKIILRRQDPVTGLLPASTAVNAHGDYTDAWVRDNVYSILSVWGLALAYRKHAPEHARSYTLSHSVVKLMRGLLLAMMRQSDRVERFKQTQNPLDALHAKYGTHTGLAVVGDDEWGHLQLDATSLFLLMLAQMTASGLQIIFNADEVNFVQNLVHYISRTYCTPDYGIWERGNKINHGDPEINCSSVGMAKAALEALDGFNLYGTASGREGVIHVVASDIARSRFTLKSLLPRESTSKETDAALLSIAGYPAYAVEDEALAERTRGKIIKKLCGRYGCKRFLLDGHQSVLEDASRLHYEPEELRQFAHIESEWPLFFTYLLLDAQMRGNSKGAAEWRRKLEPLFVERDGERLLPELYFVPEAAIEAEKADPGSQTRIANENLPLVWAQSLYMLSQMMDDALIDPDDIDPLGRRKRIGKHRTATPLVAVIAENAEVQAHLLSLGIQSEALEDTSPIRLLHATQLSRLFTRIGINDKLGLTGRPYQVMRTISTACIYKVSGETQIFLPYHFNPRAFYFAYDNRLLVEHITASLKFLTHNWDRPGQPLLVFLVREDMIDSDERKPILHLLTQMQSGECNDICVQYGPLRILKETASTVRIDDPKGFEPLQLNLSAQERCHIDRKKLQLEAAPLNASQYTHLESLEDNALEKLLFDIDHPAIAVEALRLLWHRHNEYYEVSTAEGTLQLTTVAEKRYELLSACHDWGAVRKLADLLRRYDNRLEDVLLDIIIRQKRLAVGRAYFEKAIISKPLESSAVVEKIYAYCGDSPCENVLTQEIILHLGHLIRNEPQLFEQQITLRTWYFVQLLVSRISRKEGYSIGDAYEMLISLPPHSILQQLREILVAFATERDKITSLENLSATGTDKLSTEPRFTELSKVDDWLQWRHDAGLVGHHSTRFYKDLWYMLQHCSGIVIGDKYNVSNRIGSEQTLDTTAGEQSFELRVDTLLQTIQAPQYRQLNIEAIESLAWLFKQNSDLRVDNDIVLDILIGHAVRITWEAKHVKEQYHEFRAQAWESFYQLSPVETDAAFIKAFQHLSSEGFET